MKFIERIKAARLVAKISQEEMANKLGVSYKTYQNYEYGRTEISAKNLLAFSDITDISHTWLAYGTSNNGTTNVPVKNISYKQLPKQPLKDDAIISENLTKYNQHLEKLLKGLKTDKEMRSVLELELIATWAKIDKLKKAINESGL